MLDITFYKKQNNDNFVPCTIELCDEDYKKLIVSNFAKRFHSEKQCLIVEEEEYSIDAVYCDALVLEEAKEICNRLLFEELEKVQNYCSKIEGEAINKSKLNFMFVLRNVQSEFDRFQFVELFQLSIFPHMLRLITQACKIIVNGLTCLIQISIFFFEVAVFFIKFFPFLI